MGIGVGKFKPRAEFVNREIITKVKYVILLIQSENKEIIIF